MDPLLIWENSYRKYMLVGDAMSFNQQGCVSKCNVNVSRSKNSVTSREEYTKRSWAMLDESLYQRLHSAFSYK